MAPYIQTDRAQSAYAGTDLPDKPKQSPKLTALPFTALGALPRDVLYGSRGTGVFLPDHKLAFSTRTASGVSLTGTAIRQGDRVAASVTGSQTLAALNGSTVTALATSSGLLGLDLTTKVAPGLITTTSASIAPGPLSKKGLTGKLGWEYANEFVHIKGSTSAEPQPLINVAFASGYGELQLGADLTYSTARALECARAARSQAARKIQESSPSSAQAAPGTGAPVPGVTGVVTPSVAVGSPGPGVGPTAKPAAPTGGQLLSEGAYKNSAFSAAALVGGLTQWTAALGWKHEVHQVALSVSDAGTQPLVLAAKLSYAVTVQDGITFAAEAARDLPMQAKNTQFTPPVVFSVGVAANVSALRRAADTPWDQQGSNSNGHLMKPASGTSPLVKVKLDSDGTVSALYSDTLLTGAQGSGLPTLQATWTAQMNAKDPFGRMPRIGVAAELV